MKKIQKGTILSIIIYNWYNLITARLLDNPSIPIIEIKFSRLVIEDDKMTIEGASGSDFIYASLTKISNAKWLVDEVIY